MVTVMSAFTWLGLRWNAWWHSSSSEELQTYRALRISACLLFGWTRFEVFFIHTRQKWCRIPHWETAKSRASGSFWLVVALVTAMCTLLSLLRSKIHLFLFADCWHCQLVSVSLPFLGRGILNVRRLKIGRLYGVSNIQQWTERSSGFFAKETSTKCGGMTMFN